jgi:prephenate dehydratase
LFSSVDRNVADYILAPVVNSIGGPVHASLELMRMRSVETLDEIELRIEQHLIGCPEATLPEITTVQSHPVALAQCQRFFREYPQLITIEAYDTAGSVAEVIQRGNVTRAAIAGRRAAELYGARIIRESIHDEPENFTRFVLLSVKGNQHDSQHGE